jgi:hypothetical protein
MNEKEMVALEDLADCFEVMMVTPEMAERWLKNMVKQRKERPTDIGEYARRILEGEWMFNGETMKFTPDGRLLDGQNRLRAIVLAGRPAIETIVRNVPEEAFMTIDDGKRKTAADVLHCNGFSNPRELGAAIRFLKLYEDGKIANPVAVSLSNAKIVEIIRRNPTLTKSLEHIKIYKVSKILSAGIAIGCHYLFSRQDEFHADQFFARLGDGIGLKPGDPILLLRDRLFVNSKSKAKLKRTEVTALVIKAWNFYRAKTTIKSLRWTRGGERPEPFPRIAE